MARCRICQVEYERKSMAQVTCGDPICRKEERRQREIRKAKRAERAQTKKRLDELKTIPQLIKDADKAFAEFIRYRDRNQPCICCGKPLGQNEVGGKYDCGHYRSRGAASHLRYHPDNSHAQRKDCNRRLAGNAVEYRIGLIARIGVERVEALENNNTPHKWTHQELRDIAAHFRAETRRLQRAD